MQFEDPRTILEAAAAKPTRPVNPQALVREARRLRRLRFAAATTAVAVLSAGTSAALTLRDDERGPGPAGTTQAWCRDEQGSAAVLLRPEASETAIEEVETQIEAIPGVEIVQFVSEEEAFESAEDLYGQWTASELAGSFTATFRVTVADGAALDRLTDLTGPGVDRVVGNSTTEDVGCIIERSCSMPPPAQASVFLVDGTTRAHAAALRDRIAARPGIERVQYFSQRDAYEEFRNLYPDDPGLYENISPGSLPASLRVVGGASAITRLHELRSNIVDEVKSGLEIRRRLCPDDVSSTPSPAIEDETPTPQEEGSAPVDVPDVQPDVLGAECGVGGVQVSRTQLVNSGEKWCQFDFVAFNEGAEPAVFRYDDVLLRAAGKTIEPWISGLLRPGSSGSLFGGPLEAGLTARGQVTFLLGHDDVPTKIELWKSGEEAPYVFVLGYEPRCRTDLRDDPDRSCAFEASLQTAPSKSGLRTWASPPLHEEGRVRVALYHCGVEPVMFEGREWVVPSPPFDATNAPAGFAGTGRMTRTSEVEAVYVDRSGARIDFRVLEGWQPPPCA